MSSPASAADGDNCPEANRNTSTRGAMQQTACIFLCDDHEAADSTCDEFDFATTGIPDVVAFEIITNTGCSSTYDVTFSTASSTAPSGIEKHDLDASVTSINSTRSRLMVDARAGVFLRYLNVDVTNDTDCTQLDVLMHLYEERKD